jgi:hypothetical protein
MACARSTVAALVVSTLAAVAALVISTLAAVVAFVVSTLIVFRRWRGRWEGYRRRARRWLARAVYRRLFRLPPPRSR